ncbi:hypothetical protein [Paracoccus hibiscisoli]|uniref:hypothetical protein n=1 Tax=Paracoccus hibiscisoli TaxID=2023261 RepID=UPI00145F0ACC|nr:hypothetical protein [Paracoccus hibiscisoli]
MSKLLSVDATLRALNDAAWDAARAARRAGDAAAADEWSRLAKRTDAMVDALPARVPA